MTPARRTSLLLLLAACSGTGGSSGGRASAPLEPAVRDSAGVTLYEHPVNALERAPLITIDSAPLAVFAGDVDDPEKDLAKVIGFTFMASGDLAGYDRGEHQLLILDVENGRRIRYGRQGNGPGELGMVASLLPLPNDSFLFVDFQNDRLAVAQRDTGIVWTMPRSDGKKLRLGGVLGRVGDSLYLLTVSGPRSSFPPRAGPINEPQFFGSWRVGDDSVRRLFSVPTGWRVWQVHGEGRSLSAALYGLPFAANTQVGQWGDGFLIARGEQWALEGWDTAGRLHQVFRIKRPAIPVDDALFQRYVNTDANEMAQNFINAGRTPDVDSIRASIRDRGHADSVASYDKVTVTPNGTMWVTDYQLPGDSTWAATAIAPDGRILGRITAQPGKPPIAWGDDRVAFKTEDDLGIATITIRALHLPQ